MSDDRPYIAFAECKERITIPEILSAFGLRDQFTEKGDTLTGVCPLPDHTHGPRPNQQQWKATIKNGIWLWHCFGDCQRGGDVVELVKSLTGFDDAHVRFWFADHFGDRLSTKKPTKRKAKKVDQEKEVTSASPGQPEKPLATPINNSSLPAQSPPLKPLTFKLSLDPAVPYFKQRGLLPATIKAFELGLCQRGVLAGYIAIPVYGHLHRSDANPVGYVGRWPGDDFDEGHGRPRYKIPKGFEVSRVVYGLHLAMQSDPTCPLFVVEGPFKVFYLHQQGFVSAVSSLSATLSDEQATILASTKRRVVVLFDGDSAGREGTYRAVSKLAPLTWVRSVSLPEGTEPDDLSGEELKRLLGPF